MRTLYDVEHGRKNNFNLLRMIAASAVLVSHAYPLALGSGAEEPLTFLLGFSLGRLAVLTFFVISGFFITKSFACRRTLAGFMAARALRLYPALLAVLVLTMLVLGPLCTTLSLHDYIADPRSLTYVPRNLSLKWLQYDLPGVFLNNPYPGATNGSLWSLFYEVGCYGMVVAVGLAGLTAGTHRFLAFLASYIIFYIIFRLGAFPNNAAILNASNLSLPFVLGMTFYQFRRVIPLHSSLCILGIIGALLAYRTTYFQEAFLVSWSYIIFYFSYMPSQTLQTYNRLGDYSYGMYIYAFPCEQLIEVAWRGISPAALIAVSFPLAMACAVISWHLLERHALAQRDIVERWLIHRLHIVPQ